MQRIQEREQPSSPSPIKTQSFSRFQSPSSKQPSTDPASILIGSPDSFPASPAPQTSQPGPERSHSDIFDTQDETETPTTLDGEQDGTDHEALGELPIEIQSLMERFLESLSLQSSNAALSIDRLAELYQDFYIHVESHIATHIAALSSRIAREKSPAPSVSSTGSASSSRGGRRGTRDRTGVRRQDPEQPMLTASEVFDRRKARRRLELMKLAMEEAVERGVCERVYPRLWRHSSTEDESRDAKLRSRAAALSLVGVDLKELLSTAIASEGGRTPDPSVAANSEKDTVREKLAEARATLEQVNDDRCPQSKLQRLATVHKNIVETLSQVFPSSSSADEILPTLIYVIIISPPESLNVVSNLLFIQRFRNQAKLDGEAAYCLTNLEAAISFLETVDLSSIRRDELPQGPQKPATNGSGHSTPRTEKSDPMYRGLPISPPQPTSSGAKPMGHGRRLSQMMSSKPGKPFEAASGAVDSAYDAMHNALDGSFKFLFGRLREKQSTQSPVADGGTPKTLEDAHKLVCREEKGDLGDDEEESDLQGLGVHAEISSPPTRDDAGGRMLELIGGKRTSSKELLPASAKTEGGTPSTKTTVLNGPSEKPRSDNASVKSQDSGESASSAATPTPGTGYNNAVEQMRSFSNSLNPLNYKGFSMRGFARTPTPTAPPPSAALPSPNDTLRASQVDGAAPSPAPTITREVPKTLDFSGVGPPIQRFVELKEAKELNGFDTELLLRDYQRLAGALRALQS